MINAKPKLLKPERIIELYKIYTITDQLFEGSTMLEIFEHIAALTKVIKERDQQLVSIINAKKKETD